MGQVFLGLGLACVACVVIISVILYWYIKKRAVDEPEQAERYILRGAFVRTTLSVLAAVFFVLSNVIA